MRRRKKQKGFVLLLVLAMLVIATILSVGMARRSLEQNVTAARREAELQQRWSEISCRQAVLNRAEILIRTEELVSGMASPTLQTTVKLGDRQLTLLLSDEQSKLSLNTAYRYGKTPAVRQALFKEAALWPHRIRPDPRASTNNIYPPAFSGWGQVYDFSEYARNLTESDSQNNVLLLTQLGERVTCWGNGQLNVNRADPVIFRRVCELVVSPQSVTTLLEFREEHPDWSFEKFMKEVDIPDRERRVLWRVLTDRSRCHSLWTITTDATRSWVRLDIRTVDAPAGNDLETFFF